MISDGESSIAGWPAAAIDLGEESGIRGRWLGRVEFSRALEIQEVLVREHASHGDRLLLLEHPPVYTTGRGGRAENLPRTPTSIPLIRIGRGGDVTYHGPGQLVAYPVVDLRRRGSDVHRFLRALEQGVIVFLEGLGVRAARHPGSTGVWVETRKIASIGIGVRRGISMHGLAVNLAMDLSPFDAIVPCGLEGVQMTSVDRERPGKTGVLDLANTALASAAFRALAREIGAGRGPLAGSGP